MTNIESKTVAIAVSADRLFNYLGNFNNFQHIMPPQVTKWQSTENNCSFNIQGMADIEMEMTEKVPFESIKISASGSTPVSLHMTWKFLGKDDKTDTRLILDADLNPMLAMMAKAPLNNFVNLLVDKLKELAENGKI
jgi:carbon monoxide dehydrogenase subunit G